MLSCRPETCCLHKDIGNKPLPKLAYCYTENDVVEIGIWSWETDIMEAVGQNSQLRWRAVNFWGALCNGAFKSWRMGVVSCKIFYSCVVLYFWNPGSWSS